jgi:undecaprenyl-diphosphatase
VSPPGNHAGPEPGPELFAGPSRRAATVALVVSGLGFALFALLVTAGATAGLDRWLLRALRTSEALDDPLGPALVGDFFFDVTHVGGRSILGLFGILAAGFLIVLRDWRGLGFLVLSLLGGAGLAGFFKRLFERVRPESVPHLADETSLSFPSGHATYSALAGITFCVLLFRAVGWPPARAYIAVVAVFVVLLVGFSRVWLGVHYPSDVLAGWCLGIAWASASWLVSDRLPGR